MRSKITGQIVCLFVVECDDSGRVEGQHVVQELEAEHVQKEHNVR